MFKIPNTKATLRPGLFTDSTIVSLSHKNIRFFLQRTIHIMDFKVRDTTVECVLFCRVAFKYGNYKTWAREKNIKYEYLGLQTYVTLVKECGDIEVGEQRHFGRFQCHALHRPNLSVFKKMGTAAHYIEGTCITSFLNTDFIHARS